MKESGGKKQDNLIMDLDSSVDGEVRATITDYLKKIVSEFTETIQGRVTNPAEEHLSTVREYTNGKLLDKYQATAFHHSAA